MWVCEGVHMCWSVSEEIMRVWVCGCVGGGGRCISERQKSVNKQHGAVQCTTCNRWFRSHGGAICPDLTKQVKPLPPYWGVACSLNGSKTEGKKVCVHVCMCVCMRECV